MFVRFDWSSTVSWNYHQYTEKLTKYKHTAFTIYSTSTNLQLIYFKTLLMTSEADVSKLFLVGLKYNENVNSNFSV